MKTAPDPISPGRKRLFWLILLLSPAVLLAAAELLLRLADYGGNLDIITTKRMVGKEYYTVNHDIARRYFSQKNIALPEPHDDLFSIVKQPGTKRIFMLGESTMAGFPYDYNATAPFLLRDRLERLLPQYHIEVVNFALSAVNSYSVLDMIADLAPYQPDAYVVYVGHNEFYGALGVGSTESLGSSRALIRFALSLRNIRLYRLLRDTEQRIVGWFHSGSAPGAGTTLMEAMAGSKAIPYQSDDYRRARDAFEANLRDIIGAARAQNVPIVFSTLTSNIRDQKPFQPVYAFSTGQPAQRTSDSLIVRGYLDLQLGRWPDLSLAADGALAIDSTNAASCFLKAKSLDHAGDVRRAKLLYERARDFDALRFRASGEFNSLIRHLCAEDAVPLADADSAFDAASPDGIVGSNLMLEHLHPTFDGYFLLAKTFCAALAANGIPAPGSSWHREREWTDRQYRDSSGVTGIETETARYMIGRLTSRWPFTSDTHSTFTFTPSGITGTIVLRFMHKQITWSQAHYELGDWYRDHGQFDSAIREYYSIAKVQPYLYIPAMYIGDAYRGMKNDSAAVLWYRHALELDDSPFLHVRLGILAYDHDSLASASREFETALARETVSRETMSRKENAIAYYFLGVAYAKQGMLSRAKTNLQMTLELDPANTDARNLLAQIH